MLPDSAATHTIRSRGDGLRRVASEARLFRADCWSPSHRPILSFWSVVAVMRRVSEATGVRTGHVRKQASQAYAEEGLT